jgi:putative FmdB family regulatory protein
MPLYAFLCETCGQFDLWRSFAEMSHPIACPTCKSDAKRVYTPPGLAKIPTPLTHALDRAHKSAYEPAVIKRQRSTGEERPPAAPTHHHHGRPWQIGH